MNDRNKHKVTGQINHQTADLKANASVFLFFPTHIFQKQFEPTAQMAHLVLPDTQVNPSQNQKSHFLPTHFRYLTIKFYFCSAALQSNF